MDMKYILKHLIDRKKINLHIYFYFINEINSLIPIVFLIMMSGLKIEPLCSTDAFFIPSNQMRRVYKLYDNRFLI